MQDACPHIGAKAVSRERDGRNAAQQRIEHRIDAGKRKAVQIDVRGAQEAVHRVEVRERLQYPDALEFGAGLRSFAPQHPDEALPVVLEIPCRAEGVEVQGRLGYRCEDPHPGAARRGCELVVICPGNEPHFPVVARHRALCCGSLRIEGRHHPHVSRA